jgi:hypothetical protein
MQQPSPAGLSGWTLAYLGPDTPHADALEAFASRQGANVIRCPDSAQMGLYRGSMLRRGRRSITQLFGRPPQAFVRRTLAELDRHSVRLLLCYWGVNPLGDVRAIRRARPNLPCIAVMLCHPTALTSWRIAWQNQVFHASLSALSGVIFPSTTMAKSLPMVDEARSLVARPLWPGDWHSSNEPITAPTRPQTVSKPRLIFLGRMDGGQPCDNLRPLIRQLTAVGVEVHHVIRDGERPEEGCVGFPPQPLPAVIAHTRQFDASLVAYNLDVCPRTDRFRNTIPDRLISSVAAGVPIALPTEGFDAVTEYLKDYPAILRFRTPNELANQLRESSMISQLRVQAQQAQSLYRAERDDQLWVDFLKVCAAGS